jgi:hypothetical protein
MRKWRFPSNHISRNLPKFPRAPPSGGWKFAVINLCYTESDDITNCFKIHTSFTLCRTHTHTHTHTRTHAHKYKSLHPPTFLTRTKLSETHAARVQSFGDCNFLLPVNIFQVKTEPSLFCSLPISKFGLWKGSVWTGSPFKVRDSRAGYQERPALNLAYLH